MWKTFSGLKSRIIIWMCRLLRSNEHTADSECILRHAVQLCFVDPAAEQQHALYRMIWQKMPRNDGCCTDLLTGYLKLADIIDWTVNMWNMDVVFVFVFNVRRSYCAHYWHRLDVCPSLCLSVTRWYCVKTAQPIVKLSSLPGSIMILVFWGPNFFPEFQWEHPQWGC